MASGMTRAAAALDDGNGAEDEEQEPYMDGPVDVVGAPDDDDQYDQYDPELDEEVVTVFLDKETDTTRIGIGLRPDVPSRAIVATVAEGSPASLPDHDRGGEEPFIQPGDELIAINGVECESAVHAVKLIREAPAGRLEIAKVPREPGEVEPEVAPDPDRLQGERQPSPGASSAALERRSLFKQASDSVLGVSFSPDYRVHSVVKAVKEGGLAEQAQLRPGDLVRTVNGAECSRPADTARLLRESVGVLEFVVVAADKIDQEEVMALEDEEREHEEAELEAARQRAEEEGGGGEEDYDDDDDDDDDRGGGDDYQTAARAFAPRAADLPPSPARRLPPSLAGLSPDGRSSPSPLAPSPHMPVRDAASTKSSTRNAPPLAGGLKPQGWREWLQQKRAQTRPAPEAPDDGGVQQRI